MDYELIVPYIPNLRRYARALVGDRDGADDLVQDTLERAVRKFHLWRPGDLRAWLFSIMHNVFVNQLALRRREHSTASLDADEGRGAWDIGVRDTQSDRVELEEVLTQLGQLPVDQREVLILAAVEEMRYAEIAEMIGVPIGTVMSRLNRAREKLRRLSVEPQAALKVVK